MLSVKVLIQSKIVCHLVELWEKFSTIKQLWEEGVLSKDD